MISGLPLERVFGLSRADAVASPLTVEHDTILSTVAGIECTRVVIARAQRPVGDACVASWERLGFSQTDIEVFRSLANFQRYALGGRGVTPLEFVPDQAFDLIVQFDGFPLSFRRIVEDQERRAIRVRSIENLPSDETLFSAPVGCALRPGYSALTEQLSASDSTNSRASKASAAKSSHSVQPAASPAPAPRVKTSKKRTPRQRHGSISILA